jgi:hypothetical protein
MGRPELGDDGEVRFRVRVRGLPIPADAAFDFAEGFLAEFGAGFHRVAPSSTCGSPIAQQRRTISETDNDVREATRSSRAFNSAPGRKGQYV